MAVLDVATDAELINLPAPRQSGGKPLCVALKDRRSEREFRSELLSLQMLSNLLWAAFGITHADGRRTAPSARNWQEIDIYVAMKSGPYLYHARAHRPLSSAGRCSKGCAPQSQDPSAHESLGGDRPDRC